MYCFEMSFHQQDRWLFKLTRVCFLFETDKGGWVTRQRLILRRSNVTSGGAVAPAKRGACEIKRVRNGCKVFHILYFKMNTHMFVLNIWRTEFPWWSHCIEQYQTTNSRPQFTQNAPVSGCRMPLDYSSSTVEDEGVSEMSVPCKERGGGGSTSTSSRSAQVEPRCLHQADPTAVCCPLAQWQLTSRTRNIWQSCPESQNNTCTMLMLSLTCSVDVLGEALWTNTDGLKFYIYIYCSSMLE